jgi:glutathione synthase/RimK-type ligase-like ATP-grasp enzyme
LLLVVTSREDLTADWLILELEQRGTPFVRFNTEDYPARARLVWRPDYALLELAASNRHIDLREVAAVWYRRPVPPRLPGLFPERVQWAEREAREALEATWLTTDALWVNRPERNQLAAYKPEQLRRARSLGFAIPDTIVTNDGQAAADFLLGYEEAIAKPLYRGRIGEGSSERLYFTTLLDAKARGEAARLGPEPYLFQELIPKRYDVRVTVIGEEAFAARIESQHNAEAEVDWRRGRTGALPHSIEELPHELAEQCIKITRDYGLKFSAIDLARVVDGSYVFFELNPNGQWAWLEQLTGLPLRSRLADLLTQ